MQLSTRNILARAAMTLFLVLFGTSGLWAEDVTAEQAREEAMNFLTQRTTSPNGLRRAPGVKPQLTLQGKVSGLYVFNVNANDGYVIISSDDRTTPVLGFSDTGSFDPDRMPDNMRAWLQGYADEIAWLQQHGSTASSPKKARKKVGSHSTDYIAPLLSTTWNQGEPYNNLCPEYEDPQNGTLKCATGCVATAMAQVMKYFEWPTDPTQPIPGYTSPRCNHNLPELPATTFDWVNMKDDYSGGYTEAEANAVATLMQYCGWSLNMNYGPSSSSNTYNVETALKTYFGYSSTAKTVIRSAYTYANWTDLIYHELANARPIVYGGQSAGGGHEFVCDGYKFDSESGTDFFHINWGWGSLSDGFFTLSALDPDQQGIGGSSSTDGYHYGQDAVIGIQKAGGTGTVLELPEFDPDNLWLYDLSPSHGAIALGESIDVTLDMYVDGDVSYEGDLYLYVNDDFDVGKTFVIPARERRNCVLRFTPTEAGEYSLGVVFPNYSGSYNGWENLATLTVIDQTPTELSATDITSETANIYWLYAGGATQWNLRSRTINSTIEDFNKASFPSGWARYDSDGDGKGWKLLPSVGLDGTRCVASASCEGGNSLNPENWLVTPEFTAGGTVSFCAWGADEHFSVLYNLAGNDYYYYLGNEIIATSTPMEYTYDLSNLSGTIKIAILHHNSAGHTSASYLYVDDFTFINPGEWMMTYDVTASPYRLTGMSKETTYQVQAQAVINGGGNWSEPITFSTTGNDIELASAASNAGLINRWDGVTANVTLTNRTLYKDGEWNTICLPFSLDATQLAESPLAGADIRTLAGLAVEDKTATLNFTAEGTVTGIEAGKPYLVKWTGSSNIANPVFNNVVVNKAINDVKYTSDGKTVTFKGTYDRLGFAGENRSILFVGTGNKLFWPLAGASIGAMRSYFELDGFSSETNGIKQFIMDYGEDDPTGIAVFSDYSENSEHSDNWFDLSGRKLDGKPATKGIYVNGGRKVTVK